jgi:hypothetical protein
MFGGMEKETEHRGRKSVAADCSRVGESLRVDGAKLPDSAVHLIAKPGDQLPGLKTSTRLALRLPDLLLLRAEGVAAGISKETIENARQMLDMETRRGNTARSSPQQVFLKILHYRFDFFPGLQQGMRYRLEQGRDVEERST